MGVPPHVVPARAPAPKLPPGSRDALIIATANYDDPDLRQLRSPVRDAEDLAAVLADPQIGGFIVTQLIDQSEAQIRRAIAAYLAARSPTDTVLIYLSCHGIQDPRNRLYFAATDSIKSMPQASAVRAEELLEALDNCRARRQIVILDCCFSGSFGHRGKGGPDLKRLLVGHSRGREVLTASGGLEYSFEGAPLDGVQTGSVFTTALVAGLRTGEADRDQDGLVTLDEAYNFAYEHVLAAGAEQTPQRWLYGGEGDRIILARSPAGRAITPAELPGPIHAGLDSSNPHIRIGAVNAIADWLADPDAARALAAIQMLRWVADNDNPRVGDAARAHLEQMKSGVSALELSPPLSRRPRARSTPLLGNGSSKQRSAVAMTLIGHHDWVKGVAFSPDGSLLVTVGIDAMVRVWDAMAGKHLRTLVGHTGWVRGVAFSSDRTSLATVSDDKTVRIWNPVSGKCLHTLHGHGGLIRGVAFSPNDAMLATASEDSTILVWDPASGEHLCKLRGHNGGVNAVAFSTDSASLASASSDSTVRLWDPVTGECRQTLKGHPGPAWGVAFSPDRLRLASVGATTVEVWSASSGEHLRTFEGHTRMVWGVAFSHDGERLASVSEDMTVRVWDVITGRCKVLEGHIGGVNAIAFSPRGRLLASAGDDMTVRIWRPSDLVVCP